MSFAPRPFRAETVRPPRDFAGFEIPEAFRGAPLDLEIGCGVGLHPIRYARANPDRYLVAIERTREKFEKFRRRLAKHLPLANLHPVHADAVAWVTHALRPASVSRIWLLYPNPSPQAASERWIRMPFFGRLVEVLRPEGEIRIVTNSEAYAREVERHARADWGLRASDESHRAPKLPEYRTHFEKKYLERGERIREWRLAREEPVQSGLGGGFTE